jgi:L,D-peptidoglycan transpeptidase YkuD (ErfK/YbiS/YcfS/YnhG family)
MRLGRIIVFSSPLDRRRGVLAAGGMRFPCALGRGGVHDSKREGDGRTPRGIFPLRRAWFRADRVPRPRTGLPVRRARPADGWCDDSGSRLYNRPVSLPFAGSHERMWRDDPLYDVVIEIGWNDRPVRPGKGSAIFMHVARAGFTPTEGCVALARGVIGRIVERLGRGSRIVIR